MRFTDNPLEKLMREKPYIPRPRRTQPLKKRAVVSICRDNGDDFCKGTHKNTEGGTSSQLGAVDKVGKNEITQKKD
jgi:hypothetical protein